MSDTPVTAGRLARFWLPLQVTWLFMAAEALFLAAVIARLPDPKVNLAAHGVAYAFAIIVEAPEIMMLSAATALVALWILLPWPAAIGYRRFYQGILIRADLTERVA